MHDRERSRLIGYCEELPRKGIGISEPSEELYGFLSPLEKRVAVTFRQVRKELHRCIVQHDRVMAKRNFDITMSSITHGNIQMTFSRGPHHFHVHSLLSKGIRIEDDSRNYFSPSEEVVGINTRKKKSALFPYVVFHEVDHARIGTPSARSAIREACRAVSLSAAASDASTQTCAQPLANLRQSIESLGLIDDISKESSTVMLRMLDGSISDSKLAVEQWRIAGSRERRAWQFAQTQAHSLEKSHGFDFGVPQELLESQAHACLGTYCAGHALSLLCDGGIEALRQYSSPFLAYEEMPIELKNAIESAKKAA